MCGRILDHYRKVVRHRPECSGATWPARAQGLGLWRWAWQSSKQLARYGQAARDQYGRSLARQWLDHWNVWRTSAVLPMEYYDGQLARHGGGKKLFGYLNFRVLTAVLIDIQLRALGPLDFRMYDKLHFHDWCLAHSVPCAPQVSVPSGRAIRIEALQPLGRHMIIKPRVDFGGHNIEPLTQKAGSWWVGERKLSAAALSQYLAALAARHKPGVLIQKRLFNEPGLGLEQSALSTTRVFTMLNENGVPEVVEAFRRVARDQDAIVDNQAAGGDCWMAREFQSATIALGVGYESTSEQTMLSSDPQRPEFAVGKPLPAWPRIAPFALAAHAQAPRTLAVAWDVACSSDGVVMVEANFPPSLVTQWQLLDDGFANTRVAELYTHWLGRLEGIADE